MYTYEEIEIANKTARSSGAIGKKAVIPEYVFNLTGRLPDSTILDYGAGPHAVHSVALKMMDRPNVVAYEFGDNFNPEIHDKHALSYVYDFVFASNVMNVQSSVHMLLQTLKEIHGCTHQNTVVVFNYPRTPRKIPDLTLMQLMVICESYFDHVEHIYPKKNIIQCKKPLRDIKPVYYKNVFLRP